MIKIIIEGERGSGKSVVAQIIFNAMQDAGFRDVSVNQFALKDRESYLKAICNVIKSQSVVIEERHEPTSKVPLPKDAYDEQVCAQGNERAESDISPWPFANWQRES